MQHDLDWLVGRHAGSGAAEHCQRRPECRLYLLRRARLGSSGEARWGVEATEAEFARAGVASATEAVRRSTTLPNKAMKLTRLSAAPGGSGGAASCARSMEGRTALQLIPGVGQTRECRSCARRSANATDARPSASNGRRRAPSARSESWIFGSCFRRHDGERWTG